MKAVGPWENLSLINIISPFLSYIINMPQVSSNQLSFFYSALAEIHYCGTLQQGAQTLGVL